MEIFVIRANFVGTSFTVYDNGVNPNKGEALPGGSNCRQELAAIVYVSTYVCMLNVYASTCVEYFSNTHN